MFTTNQRMSLCLTIYMNLLTIKGVYLYSANSYKNVTNNFTVGYDNLSSLNTPYSTNTQDFINEPDSTNTSDSTNTPDADTMSNWYKAPDYNSTPFSTNTPNYNTTPFSTNTPDYNSTPFSTNTPDYNSQSWNNEYDNYTDKFSNDFRDFYRDRLLTRSGVIKPFVFEALELCPQMKFCSIKHRTPGAIRFEETSDIDGYDEASESRMSNLSAQCCTYCSCLPSCLEKDNCCPDVRIKRKFSKPEHFCQTSYSFTSVEFLNKVVSHLNPITYKTIADWKESGRLFDPLKASFDDVVRVSTENRLYLNKNCALRHGETEFVRWKLIATECTSDLYSLPLQGSELETYVLRNCLVYSMPPPNLDVDSFICHSYDDMIAFCNETGLWDRFNRDIYRLCAVTKESYVYDEAGVVYRNIFCLMCNKPAGYKTPLTCPSRRQSEEPTQVSYNLHIDMKSDVNHLGNKHSNNNSECSTMQVFDVLQDTCTNLLCPFQRRPYKGECIPRLFEARNRLYPVLIKIELLESFSFDVTKSSASRIFSQLLTIFKLFTFLDVHIQNMSLSAFTSVFTDYVEFLLLTLHLRSSQKVDEEWITVFLRNLEQVNDAYIDIGNVKSTFRVSAVIQHEKHGEWQSDYTDMFYKEESLINSTKDCPECYMLSIGKMVCPHIRLNKTEFCQIKNKLYGSLLSVCLSASTKCDGNFTVEQVIENGEMVEMLYICWADYKTWTGRLRNETAEISASTRYQSLTLNAVILLATFMLYI